MSGPEASVVIINKNDPGVADTLASLARHEAGVVFETIVVDASRGRFEEVREAHPEVVWADFEPDPTRVTIAAQRNAGVSLAAAPIIVFLDAGCEVRPGWLDLLTAPIREGTEHVCSGRFVARGQPTLYSVGDVQSTYLSECPTMSMALSRRILDTVGGFDESFRFGSDVDLCWRLTGVGYRLRFVPEAVVSHDFGDTRQELRRAFVYGEARARLYATHPDRILGALRTDPIPFAYSAFLLGLPLTLWKPTRWYPLLLAIPLVKNRRHRPWDVLRSNLVYGAGALSYLGRRARGRS